MLKGGLNMINNLKVKQKIFLFSGIMILLIIFMGGNWILL